MARIEFPKPLKALLEESDLQAGIRGLADRVGEIVADNKLPFFPDYTDHGTDHINRVLLAEVGLVPQHVWEQSRPDSDPRLLNDKDAAVMIGATLLHDIAMHLHPAGFLELVNEDTRFRPLPWFSENREGHAADRPWHELWFDFEREARRFSDRALGKIIGQESVRRGWTYQELPSDPGRWEHNHHLVIGEFLRRHHPRLAHEIAIYGFPGLPVGHGESCFPALGSEPGHPLRLLADLIGLAARSHGMSLRVCQDYLAASALYQRTPRPMGAAVLYAMALLRVADYLQIDRHRAPAVLLQLRNPQSPVSVQEWMKHLAVQSIGPSTNPQAIMVTVSMDLSLEVYLQLSELIVNLQAEMDHSTAVLDEIFGTRADLGLNHLSLAIRRVDSNLQSPAFRNALPYVPERTGFTADPNLLTLLVEPLYGMNPSVGIRELMQNAVDAVRELHVWCQTHGRSLASVDLPEQDADVLIDFIQRADDTWFVRVTDRGIGMTSETIEKYFLRAGASFRHSPEWMKEFVDEKGQPRIARAGRFGIGVFALFLLGPSFRLWTRHATSSAGYTFAASADSDLIEISRTTGLRVGTTIEVEISSVSAAYLGLGAEDLDSQQCAELTDWFCWNWPTIMRRVVRGAIVEHLGQAFSAPVGTNPIPPEWSVIQPSRFDGVFWTFEDHPALSCNGFRIRDLRRSYGLDDAAFDWPRKARSFPPRLAILDSAAALPLTVQRFRLANTKLPFINDLTRDVTLSIIAHALVCGPTTRTSAHASGNRRSYHPLTIPLSNSLQDTAATEYGANQFRDGHLRWCSSQDGIVPADPWLYSLLGNQPCLVFGLFRGGIMELSQFVVDVPLPPSISHHAMLRWDLAFSRPRSEDRVALTLKLLAQSGILAVGLEPLAAATVVSIAFPQADAIAGWTRSGFRARFGDKRENSAAHSECHRFELTMGNVEPSTALEEWVTEIEHAALSRLEDWVLTGSRVTVPIFFAAEIISAPGRRKPKSLIATLWNECLGANLIPFEPTARRDLVEHGRQHPELMRHIEAWEEMKRIGSKWVTGEWIQDHDYP